MHIDSRSLSSPQSRNAVEITRAITATPAPPPFPGDKGVNGRLLCKERAQQSRYDTLNVNIMRDGVIADGLKKADQHVSVARREHERLEPAPAARSALRERLLLLSAPLELINDHHGVIHHVCSVGIHALTSLQPIWLHHLLQLYSEAEVAAADDNNDKYLRDMLTFKKNIKKKNNKTHSSSRLIWLENVNMRCNYSSLSLHLIP